MLWILVSPCLSVRRFTCSQGQVSNVFLWGPNRHYICASMALKGSVNRHRLCDKHGLVGAAIDVMG